MDIIAATEAFLVSAGEHPVVTTIAYAAVASFATIIRYHIHVRRALEWPQFRLEVMAENGIVFDAQAVFGIVLYAICWPCTLTFALAELVFNVIASQIDRLSHAKLLKLPFKPGGRS